MADRGPKVMTAISDPATIISQGIDWRVACDMKTLPLQRLVAWRKACCRFRFDERNIIFCQLAPLATFLDGTIRAIDGTPEG
jgi:hypothetical protein